LLAATAHTLTSMECVAPGPIALEIPDIWFFHTIGARPS
jgi:hypothetical protein